MTVVSCFGTIRAEMRRQGGEQRWGQIEADEPEPLTGIQKAIVRIVEAEDAARRTGT